MRNYSQQKIPGLALWRHPWGEEAAGGEDGGWKTPQRADPVLEALVSTREVGEAHESRVFSKSGCSVPTGETQHHFFRRLIQKGVKEMTSRTAASVMKKAARASANVS